ncbi:poly(ethylene terephthalate) hydrolase family protein [Pseudomonas profundi]|uniref:poly(ethylene terephthalate) hydrolase family protein n=1 Tax=Pseudomonas profundi TaxID=1981513 RepID=UPI001CC26526|nr:alpha/beta hydrolase [Pseudomonas profundi]
MMNLPVMKLSAFTLGLALSASALAGNPPGGNPPGDLPVDSGFPAVNDFAADGPFATTASSEGPSCRISRPRTLGEDGLKHPIIIWGNGTGGGATTYAGLHEHWASHGFVVAAATTANAGSGEEMIACLDYLAQQNGRSGGTYGGKLDLNRIGASGHSQGGGGTIMAGQDPRITTTAPFQPYVLGLGHESSSQRNQNGPMFLMTGSDDTLAGSALNGRPVFRNANVPVFWGELQGVAHFEPVGDAGGYRGPSTAWYRYQLMGDQNAAGVFEGSDCTLCTSRDWEVQKKDFN